MYDPDPARPTLRLGAEPARTEAAQAINSASYDDQVLEALRLYCRAVIDLRAVIAQAQPISAQADAQALARYDQADPLRRLHMGEHDGRVFQHAAGPHPIVFRTTGDAERLDAAARGEIGDAAEDLRQKRIVQALNACGFERLHEDDGA